MGEGATGRTKFLYDNHDENGVFYSDQDGKLRWSNTLQADRIMSLYYRMVSLFIEDPKTFVACNLLWYPVKGNNQIHTAPDVMVAPGRPKGDRWCYMQWMEADAPPSVVFEVTSLPENKKEMEKKFQFYDQYGVEEYFIFDPYEPSFEVYSRYQSSHLIGIDTNFGYNSKILNLNFELCDFELRTFINGREYLTEFDQMIAERDAGLDLRKEITRLVEDVRLDLKEERL